AQSTTCGASVAPGKTCGIDVTFTPTAMGARPGLITIVDSASSSPETVPLSGTGVVNLTLSATKLNFGSKAVGTVAELQTVRISNSSTIPIVINSITITGDFTQLNACAGNVPAAFPSFCDFDIRFT